MRIALVAFALVSMSVACFGADEQTGTAANAEIIEALPVFPDAREVQREVSPYTLSDSGPPDGYNTRVTYAVDDSVTPQAVVDFYLAAMKGWATPGPEPIRCIDAQGRDQDCGIVNIRFLRGDAVVSINTENLTGSASTFDVAVEATRCAKDDSAFCDPKAP